MIHIFVNNNYNKETLKTLLEFINTTVDRELTYGVNIADAKDVVVEIDPIDAGIALELSCMSGFEGDLCIIVEEEYCKAFLNGDSMSIRKYVEEME